MWARVVYGQELYMDKNCIWTTVVYGQECCIWARVLMHLRQELQVSKDNISVKRTKDTRDKETKVGHPLVISETIILRRYCYKSDILQTVS